MFSLPYACVGALGVGIALIACVTYSDANDPGAAGDAGDEAHAGNTALDAATDGDTTAASDSGSDATNCALPCGSLFCDGFERAIPDESGWTYAGNLTATAADFAIVSSMQPCSSHFHAHVAGGASAAGATASRLLARAVPNGTATIEFDLTIDANLMALGPLAHVYVFLLAGSSRFSTADPYVAIAFRPGGIIVATRRVGDDNAFESAPLPVEANRAMHVQLTYRPDLVDVRVGAGDLAAPGPGALGLQRFVFLGVAVDGNTAPDGFTADFDDLVVSN